MPICTTIVKNLCKLSHSLDLSHILRLRAGAPLTSVPSPRTAIRPTISKSQTSRPTSWAPAASGSTTRATRASGRFRSGGGCVTSRASTTLQPSTVSRSDSLAPSRNCWVTSSRRLSVNVGRICQPRHCGRLVDTKTEALTSITIG